MQFRKVKIQKRERRSEQSSIWRRCGEKTRDKDPEKKQSPIDPQSTATEREVKKYDLEIKP